MSTYAEHLRAAAGFAALTLTMPTPTDPAVRAAVRVLQGDAAGLLAEMTGEITGLPPADARRAEIHDVARHPVRTMLNRLATVRATTVQTVPGVPAPSDRLAGRPATPREATGVVGAWQGLVVQLAQARHILTGRRDLTSDEQRWAAVAEIATFAQVLGITRTELLGTTPDASSAARLDRTHAAALSVEAREVTRLAGAPTGPAGTGWAAPQHHLGVLPVSAVGHVPGAAGNLGRLLRRAPGSITDLLTVTTVLAGTSRATAAALRAAATAEPARAGAVGPVAAALDAHAAALGAAVAAERATLTGLTPSSPVLLAQAREISAFALPRLADLARHPDRAAAALSDLLSYAAQTPALTAAMRDGVQRAARRHTVAIRNRDDDAAPNRWRPADTTDLARLTANLTSATHRAEPARTHEARASQVASGEVAGLAAALERRRDHLRPARPSTAALNGAYTPFRRTLHGATP